MDERFREIYLEHLARSTAAIERLADKFAPAPSAPPEQSKGEAVRRGVSTERAPLVIDPDNTNWNGPPPAQAATEVTHEMARAELQAFYSCILHEEALKSYNVVQGYIDQQRRRDAAAQAVIPGLVRAAEMIEQRDGGEVWDDAVRKALALARGLGFGSAPFAQVPQAAARVEGWTLRDTFVRRWCNYTEGSGEGQTFRAELDVVVAEARAAALPDGAREALREWQGMPAMHRIAIDDEIRSLSPTAARLLRALAGTTL